MEGILDDPSAGAEGCVMHPEVAYVRQPVYEGEGDARKKVGEKVFFFEGKPNMLVESLDDSVSTIVENYDDLELTERVLPNGQKTKLPKDGTIFVEGPYQRSDVENANKRVYPRKLWERLIGDTKSSVQQMVNERRMIGHLEHPKDGRTDGKEGALLNVSLKLREDGVVWGKSELLDTPAGLILQEYTRKNVKWGVSSRGNGTVGSDGKVNEADFQLVTFDAVMNPSTPGAFPSTKKVNSSTTESAGDTVVESEEAQAFIAEAEKSRDLVVSELNENERVELARKLVAQLGTVGSLEKSKALTMEKSTDIRDWLTTKLSEAMEPTEPDFDSILDEALSDDADTDPDNAGVVASLQERLSDALEEAETERERANSLETSLSEAQQELEEVRQLLTDTVAEKDEAESRAALAESLLADQSSRDYANSIEESVNSAIEELPQLEKYRDVLERAESPEEVQSIAGRLVEDIAEEMRGRAAAVSTSFVLPTLPSGLVVESEKDVAKPSKGRNPSSGARLAGKAVAAAKQ